MTLGIGPTVVCDAPATDTGKANVANATLSVSVTLLIFPLVMILLFPRPRPLSLFAFLRSSAMLDSRHRNTGLALTPLSGHGLSGFLKSRGVG